MIYLKDLLCIQTNNVKPVDKPAKTQTSIPLAGHLVRKPIQIWRT